MKSALAFVRLPDKRCVAAVVDGVNYSVQIDDEADGSFTLIAGCDDPEADLPKNTIINLPGELRASLKAIL